MHQKSAVSSCWSSQGFPVLHYRLYFLQCDWRREISLQKVIIVNEARGIGRMSPDVSLSSWVGSGHETTASSAMHVWDKTALCYTCKGYHKTALDRHSWCSSCAHFVRHANGGRLLLSVACCQGSAGGSVVHYCLSNYSLQEYWVAVNIHGCSFIVKCWNIWRSPTLLLQKLVRNSAHGRSFTRLWFMYM